MHGAQVPISASCWRLRAPRRRRAARRGGGPAFPSQEPPLSPGASQRLPTDSSPVQGYRSTEIAARGTWAAPRRPVRAPTRALAPAPSPRPLRRADIVARHRVCEIIPAPGDRAPRPPQRARRGGPAAGPDNNGEISGRLPPWEADRGSGELKTSDRNRSGPRHPQRLRGGGSGRAQEVLGTSSGKPAGAHPRTTGA